MIRDIVSKFPISKLLRYEKIVEGLINETFKITASSGCYILQKLNRRYSTLGTEDIEAVLDYLKTVGLPFQTLVRTIIGEICYCNVSEIWRMFTYVPGVTYARVENSADAYQAGLILGKFHRAECGLSGCELKRRNQYRQF